MKKSQPFQTYAQRIVTMREDAKVVRSRNHDIASTELGLLREHMQDSIMRIERMQDTIRMMSRRANAILDTAMKAAGLEEYVGVWSITLRINPYMLTMFTDKHDDITVRFSLNMNGKKYKGDIKKCPLFKIMNFYLPLRWLDMQPYKLRKEMEKLL